MNKMLVLLEAKPGKERQLEEFLKASLAGTGKTALRAEKLSDGRFGIFDGVGGKARGPKTEPSPETAGLDVELAGGTAA